MTPMIVISPKGMKFKITLVELLQILVNLCHINFNYETITIKKILT